MALGDLNSDLLEIIAKLPEMHGGITFCINDLETGVYNFGDIEKLHAGITSVFKSNPELALYFEEAIRASRD